MFVFSFFFFLPLSRVRVYVLFFIFRVIFRPPDWSGVFIGLWFSSQLSQILLRCGTAVLYVKAVCAVVFVRLPMIWRPPFVSKVFVLGRLVVEGGPGRSCQPQEKVPFVSTKTLERDGFECSANVCHGHVSRLACRVPWKLAHYLFQRGGGVGGAGDLPRY